MVAKIKTLIIVYLVIAIAFYILDFALLKITGITFSNSTIYQGGVLTVEKGVAHHNYWREELIYYTVLAVIAGSILTLWKCSQEFSSRKQAFLLSKRLNVISGLLLLFCSLGFLMFTKRVPDQFSNLMAVVNIVVVLGVIARWVAKEIYVFNNRKPNK